MNLPYSLGVYQAMQDSGLIKSASTGSLVAAALAGKVLGGGLGAAYPQYLGFDPDNRMMGGAIGAMLGGGLGVGAHEFMAYFKNLAAAGKPILAKSKEALIKQYREGTEFNKKLLEELRKGKA